jgi:hypothetical protein
MNFNDRPTSASVDVYERLLGLSPKPRMIAGAIAIAGGVAVTILLWDRGVLWGLPIFAGVGGLFLFFSGIAGMNREKDRKAKWTSFLARKRELLESMAEEKRAGRNPIRWLTDQGIHDPQMRNLLIEELDAALKGQSPPELPGKSCRP